MPKRPGFFPRVFSATTVWRIMRIRWRRKLRSVWCSSVCPFSRCILTRTTLQNTITPRVSALMSSNDGEPPQPCLLHLDELEDSFWSEVVTRLPKLKAIITEHFHSPCTDLELLGEGAYARAYRATLHNGSSLVARIAAPVRDGVKTEAEVATMEAISGASAKVSMDPGV